MKRRRGRRGYWWWSWLLLLVTAGMVTGGYFYGEKQWAEAPKEYLGVAKVSFKVRPPFVARNTKAEIPQGTLANVNELEVLREAKSDGVLAATVNALDLSGKWKMGTAEAVNRLRAGLEFDLDKETSILDVQVTLNDPRRAADVANAVAEGMGDFIKELDEQKKAAAYELLKSELQPVEDLETDARMSVQKALENNGVRIKVTPDLDLGTYQVIQDVMSAKVEWDAAKKDLQDLRAEQQEYRSYWMRALPPTKVIQKAEAPTDFVGPPLKPYQTSWATYGLTAGLILGSLLMLACWKLFP